MRSRSPLALIELVIMIMVFALAAALCLRAFVWSDLRSADNLDHDKALVAAESAAELIKACSGDLEKASGTFGGTVKSDTWSVYFDEDWNKCSAESGVFVLKAGFVSSGINLLGKAHIHISDESGSDLTALDVCWQEVE